MIVHLGIALTMTWLSMDNIFLRNRQNAVPKVVTVDRKMRAEEANSSQLATLGTETGTPRKHWTYGGLEA